MSEGTAEVAVSVAAREQGADAARLVDSVSFMRKVAGLEPDKPGYMNRVASAVREASQAQPSHRAAPAGGAQQPKTGVQWTIEKVQASSSKEVMAAWDAGLLTDLGYGPRRGR